MDKLLEIISDWEMKNMISLFTLTKIKSGRQVTRATAFKAAKSMGADDDTASKIADAYWEETQAE